MWHYATDVPNFLDYASKINGIFQTVENTLTGLPCGGRVSAAMGPTTDAFIMRPGVNVAVIGRFVRLVLQAIDTRTTLDGFLQALTAFYAQREYNMAAPPSANVANLASGMTDLSMQARSLFELQQVKMKDDRRTIVYRADLELWFETARHDVLEPGTAKDGTGKQKVLVAQVLLTAITKVRQQFGPEMDVHEAAAQLNALVQYLRNEEAVSVASRNRLAGLGKSVRSFADLFPKGNRRHAL